ncbi:hypothetical protein BJ165DRAFT_578390 [Panaeolus papilionaceus]|nr:hypothetical protein BJ165DRAFT_578390 [Panaeolus papilionaceus]
MCFNRVLDFLTSSWYAVLFHLYLLTINSFLPSPSLLISSPSTTLPPKHCSQTLTIQIFSTNSTLYTFCCAYRQTVILIPPWSCFLRAGNIVEVKVGPFQCTSRRSQVAHYARPGDSSFPTIKIPHTFSIAYEATHDDRWNKSWSLGIGRAPQRASLGPAS